MNGPKTLVEAVQHFSDLGVCHAYMVALKWPDGRIVCPKCGGDKVGNIASRVETRSGLSLGGRAAGMA